MSKVKKVEIFINGKLDNKCFLDNRKYKGCDKCKNQYRPTQFFIGYCGDELYLCEKCFKNLISN